LSQLLRRARLGAARIGRAPLGGPLALSLGLVLAGHLLAGRAPAAAPVPTPRTYRVSDAELLPGPRVARPAAPRVPARASRSSSRPATPRPAPRWVRPARGPVTSPYGMRWGRMHNGLDFGSPYGSPVVAAYDGVVVHAGYGLSGYGRQVQVRHAGGVVTTYSHLSSIAARVGARVRAGQVVGTVGASGNVTGPHLHFEIHAGGRAVNPRAFLATRGLRL
jgi:murein DD-endopeptidase MepM/ murein hydrolase activator NlpD